MGATEERANTFADCERLFNDCEAAERYNTPHGEEEEEEKEEEQIDEEQHDDNHTEDESDNATEPATTTEKEADDSLSNEDKLNHARPMRRFILRSRN